MTFPDGGERSVRIHLVGFTGDQPAVSKTAGLVGPNGKSPCRDCRIQGFYSNHYYFSSRIKVSHSTMRGMFNHRRLPMRSPSGNPDIIKSIKQTSGTALRELQKDSGIKRIMFYSLFRV